MLLTAACSVIGGGTIWNWLASRGKQKVDLIALAQTISSETIKALKEDRRELVAQIDRLEAVIEDLKHDIRGLSTYINALETLLVKAGIEPPPRPRKKADV